MFNPGFFRLAQGVRLLALLICVCVLASCASSLSSQSRINSLITERDYPQAVSYYNNNPNAYGRKNVLLYLLDKGYVCHMAQDYNQSIDAFAKAKLKYDQLYTKSITGILSTWVLNDYTSAYRGEDFERVMMNVFQSLNYTLQGNLEEALVEARDVNSVLSLINSRYKEGQKNVYKEDAFARFLTGILYESTKSKQDANDAYIDYAKAVEIYENDFVRNYKVDVPEVLKENVLSCANFMGEEEFKKYRAKFPGTKFLSLKEKAQKSEVYLIQYNGFSPVKVEDILPIPLPDGYIVQLAFPRYEAVSYLLNASVFSAKTSDNRVFQAETQIAENIGGIARQNLDNRKARVIAKAIASSAGKYIIEKKQEETIQKRYGANTAFGFRILSSLFNVFSSRADIRCWQTLPDQIRISRLLLEPGRYSFTLNSSDSYGAILERTALGEFDLSAGQKKFFIVRTAR